jgi:hypothetical protein
MLLKKKYIERLQKFTTMVLTYENVKKKYVGQEHKRVKAYHMGFTLGSFMTCM